ncbi:family 16 glycoside hydrolase [uncultured Fibrella sp.]|uniref:family 16 glycoside hydrolase n=1 Tax=uncultured Fibrella sp. TaxID=1284596 RepID=UPI0035CBFD8D
MRKKIVVAGLSWLLGFSCSFPTYAVAQAPPGTSLALNDLSAFKPTAPNWRIVGGVRAELTKPNTLLTEGGTGVLVNSPVSVALSNPNANLATLFEHGDADIDFDYLMASGANSGLYLQGRYEVQLLDSWTVRTPKASDNGSIYERWDDSRGQGREGYDGHPARQNASRAPGLWQHLRISFQAPRFNAEGKKTQNARLLHVELNGVVIHENVELTGPTRGSAFTEEAATGPLLFQGDHGAVAFRNIRYVSFDKPRPQLLGLTYAVYKGRYEKEPVFAQLKPDTQGDSEQLTASVSRLNNEFALHYMGTLRVHEPGEYRFDIAVPGGSGRLRVNGQSLGDLGWWAGGGPVTLPKGDVPIELYYAKLVDWAKPSVGLTIAGPGIRAFTLSGDSREEGEEVDPIRVETPTTTVLRSFVDVPVSTSTKNQVPKTVRITHAVSVGSPDGVHYTYDLDKGTLVQVWRGQFLDATPMWHDRGDGSARPLGMVVPLGALSLTVARLTSPQTNWPADTIGSGFRPRGYVLDADDRPTFRYQSFGLTLDDCIRVLPDSKGVQRTVSITNQAVNPLASTLYAQLATGTRIRALEDDLYLIDEQQYVRVDDLGGTKPTVRDAGGRQELIVPVTSRIVYSILF